jgi:FkbM family methyltransferase
MNKGFTIKEEFYQTMRLPFLPKMSFYHVKTKNLVKFTSPQDIVLDVGANVGEFAKRFVGTGCAIKCFEPNPVCIPLLNALAKNNNIDVVPAAASTLDGDTSLYLHESNDSDPMLFSTGSSLLKQKVNIDHNNFVNVKTIDLARYIHELNAPVRVLKVDIEGYEVNLMPYLLETGCLSKVSYVLVETHEKKNPFLRAPTENMKELFRIKGFDRIDWDWI